VADYVLSNFDTAERAELPDLVGRALGAVERLVREGPSAAMNAVNVRGKK
jgi:peptidyl-tRNA hydrolase